MSKQLLIKKGHSVDVASNGKRALVLIKNKQYDIAFLDHNMPELTGLELIKYIKDNDLKIKTIILSAYPEIDDFFAKTVGADEYLEKPYQLSDIEEIVNKYNYLHDIED